MLNLTHAIERLLFTSALVRVPRALYIGTYGGYNIFDKRFRRPPALALGEPYYCSRIGAVANLLRESPPMETAPWHPSLPSASQPHRGVRPSSQLCPGRMAPVPHRPRSKARSMSAALVVTVVVVVVVTAVIPAAGSTPSLHSRLGLGSQSRHPTRRRSDSQGA